MNNRSTGYDPIAIFQHLAERNSIAILLCFFLLGKTTLQAQVLPQEGAVLNYRIVGFALPETNSAGKYSLEIAKGKFTSPAEFERHIFSRVNCTGNKVIAEVPDFGCAYTWRLTDKKKRPAAGKNALFHFTTGVFPANDKRLHVTANWNLPQNYYIMVDGTGVAYDMQGKPVWFLPDSQLRTNMDIKVTKEGSLTFLGDGKGYEVGYDGHVSWSNQGVGEENAASRLRCHHEFIKRPGGTYMSLLASMASKPISAPKDRVRFFAPAISSILAEFDEAGNLIWKWDCEKYIENSDLSILREVYPDMPIDLHENAFLFDETNKVIYLSMAGISRILKISYPSGKVLNEYGRLCDKRFLQSIKANMDAAKLQYYFAHNWFITQHSLMLSDDRCLLLISNNIVPTPDKNGTSNIYPKVLKLKESADTLQPVWDFDYRSLAGADNLPPGGGGNVVPLKNNLLFISNCSPYDDMFIVDSNKHVLWRAITETCEPAEDKCSHFPKYRSNILSRDQLEKLIWAGYGQTAPASAWTER